jgi:hypothetical protein
MERLRQLFSFVSRRCCFANDYTNTEQEDREAKGSLDITSSQIPAHVLQSKSVTLKLVVVESEKMTINKVYIIEPAGLINTERTSHGDNCVYAGSLYSEDNRVVNDIILPFNENGVGKKHFMIMFKEQPSPAYHLKDLGDGMGTFVRITRPLVLKNNFIVSFGESHMIVVVDNGPTPKLTLRFIDGPKLDQRLKFSFNDSPITIGRMTDCTIKFDDNSLSRYHSIITFKEKWIIEDGDGQNQSTNGTWLFAEDFFEIYDGMVMKVGETTFRAELCYVKG